MLPVTDKYKNMMTTAITSLKKTMVMGRKDSFAILNQMNDKAQNIIARIIAAYIRSFVII